ncbi:MAG: hypothetical protein K2M46_00400 [Lachnospiraceae bacterium]|nr:hypothetical protein [Lachnospiraceae bacterium]
MNSCELITFISGVACALAKQFSPKELEMMAAIFIQLGETLETYLTHQELCAQKEETE